MRKVNGEMNRLTLRGTGEWREREHAILRAVSDISAKPDLAEAVSALRRALEENLGIDGAAVILYGRTDEAPRANLSWGITETLIDGLSPAFVDSRAGRHILARPDLNELSSYLGAQADLPAQSQARYLCVPLLTKGEPLGVAVFTSDEPDVFDEDAIAFLETVGRQMGVAAERISLSSQLLDERRMLQSLSRRVVQVQEDERRHLARELHDEIGQLLTGLRLALEMAARFSSDSGKGALLNASAMVDNLLSRVRVMSLNLRPAMLDDLGLLPALLWHLENYSNQTGVSVDFRHKGLGCRLRAELETAAYRIIQEALTNVAKHARAKEAIVLVWIDGDNLCLQIEDRGSGFEPGTSHPDHPTSGLSGMRERAVTLGGKFRLESSPEDGTVIFVVLPLIEGLGEN
jgi:signal transduction histidine kinase